jgi:hypothetical protein
MYKYCKCPGQPPLLRLDAGVAKSENAKESSFQSSSSEVFAPSRLRFAALAAIVNQQFGRLSQPMSSL